MPLRRSIQYTIRQVPIHVDQSLGDTCRKSGQSLNEAAIEAMARGLGLAGEPTRYHDLDAVAGT